jgi:hypothetical protein
VSSFSDDLFGRPEQNPRIAEGLLKRAVERARRAAGAGAPPAGVYADIAAVQESAADKMELAARIAEALQAGDQGRARRLTGLAGDLYGHAAMSPLVQAQARQAQLNILKVEQDRFYPTEELYPATEMELGIPNCLFAHVALGRRPEGVSVSAPSGNSRSVTPPVGLRSWNRRFGERFGSVRVSYRRSLVASWGKKIRRLWSSASARSQLHPGCSRGSSLHGCKLLGSSWVGF